MLCLATLISSLEKYNIKEPCNDILHGVNVTNEKN